MKVMWCWRCQMELPMLDEIEFKEAHHLYGNSFDGATLKHSTQHTFRPLLDWYARLTGFVESNPNAIMHHRISLYGGPCIECGRPLRSPKARFCAACGHIK